ncbi:hypothetical protein [Proteiniborus sp.]|uniref:hypothetical protein n=1 Tax=Proteiniborus sp. TaxID=2079015 RepID=UPI003324B0EB
MINLRIQQDGLVTTSEYPSVPEKINETDIILEGIENEELERAVLDSTVGVRILDFETLGFETIPRVIEQEPTELELLGQEVTMLKLANIQKDGTINVLGQELANIKLKLLQGGM